MDDYNEYFMEYNIYLNGSKVACSYNVKNNDCVMPNLFRHLSPRGDTASQILKRVQDDELPLLQAKTTDISSTMAPMAMSTKAPAYFGIYHLVATLLRRS